MAGHSGDPPESANHPSPAANCGPREGEVPIKPFMEYMRRLEEAGISAEDLDDVVHDLKSNEATDLNNAGLEAQVEYIVSCGGEGELERILEEGHVDETEAAPA